MKRTWLVGIATAVILTASASAAYAQAGGNGNGNGNNNGNGNGDGNHNGNGKNGDIIGSLAATPELDSIVMLGSALLGGAGYIVLKRRTARR
jgi:hypothetical protein